MFERTFVSLTIAALVSSQLVSMARMGWGKNESIPD